MSKVFIIGGAGNVGRRTARVLSQRGHEALTMYRDSSQEVELRNVGAIPVNANLLELTTIELSQLMTGSTAIIFSAGAGGKGGMEMTNAIDGDGLVKAIDAAKIAGVNRFLLVSAFPEAARGENVSVTFENYMKVKKQSDVYLSESDLDWVILRPGLLTNSDGVGKVKAGLAIPYGKVTRDDVAETLVEIIEQSKINHKIIELTEGNTPIADAIRSLK